jgi:hypothetical protein
MAATASLLGAGPVLVQYARGLLHDKIPGAWYRPAKILDNFSYSMEEHLKAQAEDHRFSVYFSSIKPTLQVALLLGGYSTGAS